MSTFEFPSEIKRSPLARIEPTYFNQYAFKCTKCYTEILIQGMFQHILWIPAEDEKTFDHF